MFLFFNPRLTQQKKRSSEFWPHLGVDLAWPQGNFPTFHPLSLGLPKTFCSQEERKFQLKALSFFDCA